jgi:hypothetical protein
MCTDQWNATFSVTGIVGHRGYGLLASGLARELNLHGFAFDSSQFIDSPVAIFQDWDMENREETKGWIEQFQSGTTFQVFSDDETVTTDSHVLPNEHSSIFEVFRTPRTVETFCMIAAGCATDDYYDSFCGQLLGSDDRFSHMFELWGRTNRSHKGGTLQSHGID